MATHADLSPYPDAAASGLLRPSTWRRLVLLGGVAFVPLVVAAWPGAGAAAAGDPDLVRVLRGMALIKGLTALAALAAVLWRFGRPVSALVGTGYAASVWALWSAAWLVASLAHLVTAALLFHASLLTLLLVAWRDPGRGRIARG